METAQYKNRCRKFKFVTCVAQLDLVFSKYLHFWWICRIIHVIITFSLKLIYWSKISLASQNFNLSCELPSSTFSGKSAVFKIFGRYEELPKLKIQPIFKNVFFCQVTMPVDFLLRMVLWKYLALKIDAKLSIFYNNRPKCSFMELNQAKVSLQLKVY